MDVDVDIGQKSPSNDDDEQENFKISRFILNRFYAIYS